MNITAREIAIAAGGRIVCGNGDVSASGVSTDTRTECEGRLFVPLSGENFDGHDYIDVAYARGASVALTSRGDAGGGIVPINAALIQVGDTLEALGKLASWYRLKFRPLVVGVTGSVGKTTTKEMIALVLSKKFNVLKSEGNKNNEIGLPLTIFGLTGEHTALVLEMGMNNPGEIARLSKIARPDIAVITNIGDAHIKRLGSKQNILKAKLEILEGLSKNGTVYLNGDDMLLKGLMGLIDRPVVYYGIDDGLDFTGTDIRMKGGRGLEFEFTWRRRGYGVTLNAAGEHNVHNALAAVSIGIENGVTPKQIKEALYEFIPDRLRMNISSSGGVVIINDTYNANPQSMRAAVDVLAGLSGDGRRIAVLGDMLELGDFAGERHREIGAYLKDRGVDVLVAAGAYAADVASGANGAAAQVNGGKRVDCHIFGGREGVAEYVLDIVKPGDMVMIKGSRAMQMDRVAEAVEKAIGRSDC